MAWPLSERSKGTDVPTTKCQWGSSRMTTRPRLLHTRTEPGSSDHIAWSPICQWLRQVSFVVHICDGWRRAPGQIVVRTDACPGQMPSSGPTNIISSGMPEHDSWDEGRLPRSGTFVCLVISAQKQLKSASAGRKPRNSLAGARTEIANPCCRASIEDRLANLPTCDYFRNPQYNNN